MKDIYQQITDRMVEQLKKGNVPWQRPWVEAQNIVTQKPYRGVNTFVLACEERESPFWMTYRQAVELGGNVKKGEKSTPIIYWNFKDMKDDKGIVMLDSKGNPKQIPFIRWANVFSLEQTENIKAPELAKDGDARLPLEKAQEILEKAQVCEMSLNAQLSGPCYIPLLDKVEVPSIQRYPNPALFYHSVFHELAHATGHATRLNREGITLPRSKERYAKEELIAELSSSFLCNDAGILGDVEFKNSSSYISSWLEALGNDPKLLIAASSSAQKAAEYVKGEREFQKKSTREEILDMIAGSSSTQNERGNEHERE